MNNSAAGHWVPGEEEGDIGKPPETVKKFLEEKGSQGIIVNGVIAWILANRENGATGIWKQIIEHHYRWKMEVITEIIKVKPEARRRKY